jgi:hypothetical protein
VAEQPIGNGGPICQWLDNPLSFRHNARVGEKAFLGGAMPTVTPTLSRNDLYQADFYAWTQQQAALLRAEVLEELDLPNLSEEIEAMGRSQRKEIKSRLLVLLLHLLKVRYQKRDNLRSWLSTIRTQRNEIDIELSDSPSLRQLLPEFLDYAYLRARKGAAEETGLPLATFPVDCPWSLEAVLDADWLPETPQ